MNRDHDRKLEHEVFEKYGEETVRRLLGEGRIANQRAIAAQAWLDELEAARRAEAERQAAAVQSEQMEIARAATDVATAAGRTAERAVAAAQRAHRLALVALVVSAVALIAAIAGIGLAHAETARPGAPAQAVLTPP